MDITDAPEIETGVDFGGLPSSLYEIHDDDHPDVSNSEGTSLHDSELPEPVIEGAESMVEKGTRRERDPKLFEVARAVVSSGKASTSAVQRSFELGYNRAGRIMDQLERLGVVGPAQGGKPRALLVDPMGLEEILSTLE